MGSSATPLNLEVLDGLSGAALYQQIAECAEAAGVSKRQVWIANYGVKRKRAGRPLGSRREREISFGHLLHAAVARLIYFFII